MSSSTAERLYALLPAIYQVRDAEQGYPLRALISVIAREVALVEEDIDRLYANWFIETSDEWAVPYLGDLLGVRGLHGLSEAGFTRRAFVANTLGYRRRKGTPTMLEQLARDTTQWNARVVEFFELLGATQYLNHLRPHSLRTPDLRHSAALELIDTPFNSAAHTADVRRIASGRGRHNIPNIGIFLWRLQSYYLARCMPRPATTPSDGRYTFSPLGHAAPLFNRPQTETTITHLAGEVNVPGRLRRRALYDDLTAYRAALASSGERAVTRWFDQRQPVLEVFFDQPCAGPDPASDCIPLRPEEIVVCDLSGWDAPGWEAPDSTTGQRAADGSTFATRVAVDPVLGRLALLKNAPNPPARIETRSAYGFSGDMGGGPYDRRAPRSPGTPAPSAYANSVAAPDGLGQRYGVAATAFATVQSAVDQWALDGKPDAVIQIEDSRTYTAALTIPMAATDLVIQAANGQRPTLIGDLAISGTQHGRLALNGLLVSGSLGIAGASLRQLDLVHCTLVPGIGLNSDGTPTQQETPSVVANANKTLTVRVVRCISGPLHLSEQLVALHVEDSIIESPARGGAATLLPALVSADLSSFPGTLPATPTVQVTIGGDGPYVATLDAKPASLTEARDRLQSAIRQARSAPAFAGVQVLAIANRLVVLPAAPAEVTVEPAGGDPTAQLLGLAHGAGEQRLALVSGLLAPFPALTATTAELAVAFGPAQQIVALAPKPNTLVQTRNRLDSAIRAASPDPAFAGALVGSPSASDRLVVVAGAPDLIPAFDTTAADTTTLAQLKLDGALRLPAIGGDRTGAQPGPPTVLERTTVLGAVHVKELSGSETIFTDLVWAVRRQSGCVRFCYVPPGSRTPRRFRCQPELAVGTAQEAAQEQAPLTPEAETAIASRVLAQLRPAFSSTRYGDPAYGQLGLGCPAEIRTGAEDGSEMGAFCFLKQPQRLANLETNLEEYLRLGLEAGIFFVT